MMTLANYGIKSNRYKDPVSAKSLNKSLQIRNRVESTLKQCLKTSYRLINEKRNDILESIEDYYARVPFDVVIWNKPQTKKCVVDSILSLDYKFNPYRAREAFQIIESMLLNLHYLPWHKEFTKIVTYSGKFRQDISEPLVQAEDLLRAAGFERESDENPLHLILPQQRMPQLDSTEHVTQVIFDCMLAQVVMSDIITVLESSCKSSKLGPNQLAASTDINCYLWIQSYFRERCHQVTEKACSSIQELLNNITNHLAKQRLMPPKVSERADRSSEAQYNHTRTGETSQIAREEMGDTSNSTQRQENLRKLFTHGSLEDSNLLRLSEDLLKIPGERDTRSFNNSGSYVVDSIRKQHHDIAHNDSNPVQGSQIRHGGVLPTPYPQRYDASYVERSGDFRAIDSLSCRPGTSDERDYGHQGHPTRVDLPHNDRELLIPKRDKKFNQEHINESCQSSRNLGAHYSKRLPGYVQSDPVRNASSPGNHLTGKYLNDDFPPNRNQQASQSSQMSLKNSSLRYDHGAAHGKYEPRDIDRPSFSRMHWSCSSCTFYNHPSNEICEMCGLRKLI